VSPRSGKRPLGGGAADVAVFSNQYSVSSIQYSVISDRATEVFSSSSVVVLRFPVFSQKGSFTALLTRILRRDHA